MMKRPLSTIQGLIKIELSETGWNEAFFVYFIQHCVICRPSDFTVSGDAEIESGTVATLALALRYSILVSARERTGYL
jgi:hypothetical protein